MLKRKLINVYNAIVNRMSFSGSMWQVRRWLNTSIDHPETIGKIPDSHPRGFAKMFRKRRISIVEFYVSIIGFLGSNKCSERLSALRMLTHQVLHSKSIKMPLNTARVQMALMKEAVKSRENKRAQMERLRDFSASSFGHPRVIRRYLKEMNIIEVPETGAPLKDLHMGWDPHVHDNSSYGRKNPTQLIIDSFIKGLSEITIVYNTLEHIEIINEAIEAGSILGISVNIGLEFSIGEVGNRYHYIYLFPHFANVIEFVDYLDSKDDAYDVFLKGVAQIQKNRVQSIEDFIHNFNITHLPKINEGYKEGTIYYLNPLQLADINDIIPYQHATRMHLGELLYDHYQPVLYNRVLYLKAQKKICDCQHRDNQMSEWEYRNLLKKYESTRQEYGELNQDKLLSLYFPLSSGFEVKTVFANFSDAFPSLPAQNGDAVLFRFRENIKMIHPLKYGFARAVKTIMENFNFIGHTEIYNMHDTMNVDHYELELFARFIHLLNSRNVEHLKSFLFENRIEADEQNELACITFCTEYNIQPSCGSNSMGRTSYIPGMGFIFRSSLAKAQQLDYLKNHYALPKFVSKMIAQYSGKTNSEETATTEYEIISMGRSKEMPLKTIGDENMVEPIPLKNVWRYIHPTTKTITYIFIGFIPAYLTIGWQYALIWFGITSIRNAITDFISGRGYRLKEWHIKNIDFIFLSHSLFWTGFSVPVLNFVKLQFDLLYPLHHTGLLFEFLKFFFICMINGSYLAFHNIIRGFDKTTIQANFFRSLMAWPLAGAFAFVGNLLFIPSIVQAKFWSDFVAGLIEGSGKFRQRINLRQRDLHDILPNIKAKNPETQFVAMLDLLYFFRTDPRTQNSLKYILFQRPSLHRRVFKRFGSKHTEPAIPDFSDYEYLRRWFSQTTHYYQLIDFILEKFRSPQVLLLTDLIADTFSDFNKWLARNKPK